MPRSHPSRPTSLQCLPSDDAATGSPTSHHVAHASPGVFASPDHLFLTCNLVRLSSTRNAPSAVMVHTVAATGGGKDSNEGRRKFQSPWGLYTGFGFNDRRLISPRLRLPTHPVDLLVGLFPVWEGNRQLAGPSPTSRPALLPLPRDGTLHSHEYEVLQETTARRNARHAATNGQQDGMAAWVLTA